MSKGRGVYLALALWACAPALAGADGVQGKWSISFSGGGDLPVSGTVHQGGSGTVLGLPTAVEEKSFSDIYKSGYRLAFGAGYGIGRNVEIIGNFNLGSASSKSDVRVGNVAGLDLFGDFKKYEYAGAEGGVRLHFAPEAGVQPYVNVVGGFRHVKEISPTFRVPAASVVLSDVPFYASSNVATFGGDFGLAFRAGANTTIGFEAGLRYAGALDQDESGLAGTGLANLNDEGARWSLPIAGTISFRF